MLVEARLVSLVLRLLEVSETSALLRPSVLRLVVMVSFSPATTVFLLTVATKMRTP